MSRFARTNYANVHCSFLPLLRLERGWACICGEPQTRETTHATDPPAICQDQSILDSCAAARIVSAGKSRRLCVLYSRIDPPRQTVRLRPDKLRAYKCSIRQRRLIVCASVCFHPDASSTGIIISRTRLRTKSISGECGIIPIHSLYTMGLYDYTEFILREESAANAYNW